MNSIKFVKLILFLLLLVNVIILPQEKLAKLNSSSVQSAIPKYAKFNCNNISTFIYADGTADIDLSGGAGLQYPSLTGKTLVYQSGLILGGMIKGEIRISGSMFRSGLLPGKILPNGEPDNPASASVRAFRVRPDFKKGNLLTEVKNEGLDSLKIYNQYEQDWNEWPASSGAPFNDINGNGVYEPSIDIPGVPDAGQTIWFVANDFDPATAQKFLGTIGLGIEMQTAIWGYKKNNFLDNIIFKKYKIINKNKDRDTIKNAYLGYWSDADIGGDAGDDLVGCDTTQQMGFIYNGKNIDNMYKNESAAYGSMILSGPWDEKRKNYMSMTSFNICEWPVIYYLENIVTAPIEKFHYNFLKGLTYSGENFVNPVTNEKTKFMYPGDPFFNTGWRCTRPYDYRFLISTGPFDLAYGESKEIVIAQIAATYRTRLEALQRVKGYGILTRTFYVENLIENIMTDVKEKQNSNIPTQFILYQNYPNPFNPTTVISYQLPVAGNVSLKIFDILGREVTTLVNEYQQVGFYNSQFSILNSQLPSGIYFYSLKVGNYIETKKMVLMK